MLLAHALGYCGNATKIAASGRIRPSAKTGEAGFSEMSSEAYEGFGMTPAMVAEARTYTYFTAVPDSPAELLNYPCAFVFPPTIMAGAKAYLNAGHDFGRKGDDTVEIQTRSLAKIEAALAAVREARVATYRARRTQKKRIAGDIVADAWFMNEVAMRREVPLSEAVYCIVTIRTTDAEIDALRAACPRAKFIIGRCTIDLGFARYYAGGIGFGLMLVQARLPKPVGDHPVVAAARATVLTNMEVNDLLWKIRISPAFEKMREMKRAAVEMFMRENTDTHAKNYIYQNFYEEDEAGDDDASVYDVRVERNTNEMTLAFVAMVLSGGLYDDSRTPTAAQLSAMLADCGDDVAVAAKRLAIAHKLDRIAEYTDQRIDMNECLYGRGRKLFGGRKTRSSRRPRPRPAT
jgi:hypothetical protein